jgi:hypothetical protein
MPEVEVPHACMPRARACARAGCSGACVQVRLVAKGGYEFFASVGVLEANVAVGAHLAPRRGGASPVPDVAVLG